jgi:hypothetical protein
VRAAPRENTRASAADFVLIGILSLGKN